jgi:PAS domain S-box-containing protein
MLPFRFNIRSKLIFFLSLLVLVIISVSTFFSYFRASHAMQTEIQKYGIVVTKTFTQMAATHIFETDYITVLENALSLVKSSDIQSVTIMDANGKIWISTNKNQVNPVPMRPFYEDLLRNKQLKYRKIMKDDEWILEFGSPVTALGRVTHLVNVEISLKSMKKQLAERTQSILILSCVMISIAVFLAIVLSKLLTDPIKNLVSGTNEISQGNLDYRINVYSQDEIGELSQSFNLMADNLQMELTERKQAEQELREHRDQLEELVKERTAKLVRANREMEQEIDERKQTEEALRESEEKYRLLIDNLPNIVFKGYKDGSVDFIDDKIELLIGYKKDDFNSRKINWFDMVVEEDKEKMRQTFIEALKTDKSYVREYRIKTKTGNILWIQEGSQIVCDESGEIEYIDGAFLDISRHKKLETQLQQLDRIESIGTLAGGIAHDFNNLLMGIQGRASLMLMDSDASRSHFEHLKGIEDYVKSAADLTRQLLGFARGGKYEVKPTELNALIKDENRMFGRTRKEVTIHEKFEQNLWTVEVDRTQFEQVLLNIYVNAWQAMPGGGDLYIQTENIIIDEEYSRSYQVEPGNYVKISITDTGVGMDEATRQRIFDPFFTTKEMGRGTGLGLASAYGIIKNHNGFINVYSEKGEGTTFNIYLPASEKETGKEREIDEELIKGKGTETVLLVDDEYMIIEVGQGIIENLGYEVLIAKSGKEAIEIYKKNSDKIDMIILDMIMPNMDGGDTYDRLKEINPDVKVLLSSGYSVNGQASEILERGCDGFIQKPYGAIDLSQKIREILDED